jgi:hypothetical protein
MHEYQNWVVTRLGVVGEETHHTEEGNCSEWDRRNKGFEAWKEYGT